MSILKSLVRTYFLQTGIDTLFDKIRLTFRNPEEIFTGEIKPGMRFKRGIFCNTLRDGTKYEAMLFDVLIRSMKVHEGRYNPKRKGDIEYCIHFRIAEDTPNSKPWSNKVFRDQLILYP